MTDQVHPSIISLCQEIVACFDLDLAGVDILTTDISRPLEETGGKISEVNQNPDIVMHTNPYVGEPIDTARMFTDYLFPNSKDAWIDIKLEGRKIETQVDLNACLAKIPQKVFVRENLESEKIISIENPTKPLFNYLVNKLTVSVDL